MRRALPGFLCLLASLVAEREAAACGGLFCDQSTVVIPPAQSSERIVFVMNAAGWNNPPEGMVEQAELQGGDPDPEPLTGRSVDAYIEIAYSGAAASFAWIVPLLEPPALIGTARPEIFNDLDQATAPRFTFTYSTGSSTVSSGGGMGCGGMAAAESGDYESDGMVAEPEVTVIGTGRVGPYEVAVLYAEEASDLRWWLQSHDYQVPDGIDPILDRYVSEGKTFAAFRLADGEGIGAIEPVVIRTPGGEPCIPLRLTPVASEPVLSVTAIIMAGGLVRPGNFNDAGVDENAIRPTSPVTTDYQDRLRQNVQALGGLAIETEYAGPADYVEATSPTSFAMLERVGFVTRLSTRMAPEEMTTDPIFLETSDQTSLPRDHTIDVTNDEAALVALGVQSAAAPDTETADGDDGCTAAGRNRSPLPLLWLVPIALLLRRRRDTHRVSK